MASDTRQRDAVREFTRNVEIPAVSAPRSAVDHGQPKVSAEPEVGTTIGVVYVPRFGADYTRPLVQGTTPAVLDTLGIGHYEGTAMPGAVGNVAVAGHRQTHGAVLDNIDSLVPGDRIYVQTRDGYYVYSFRNKRSRPARQDGRPAPGSHPSGGDNPDGALPHDDQLQSALRLRGTDHRLLAAGALAAGVGRSTG